ncbi:hypothetical protein Cgig2_021930 [Carnegiea gigantea]|uniref:MI domain-containing protein n=1 Tax=Carnegiea gigantea TaxID=171969 RepID=A0A9Q1GJB4_9CARY|nr:hypothetical protein Cgig2_021930 [Carnegiea gigantea]
MGTKIIPIPAREWVSFRATHQGRALLPSLFAIKNYIQNFQFISVENTGCGMKLRGDDPAAMKDFILSVQTRVNELKAASGDTVANTHSKRMEFMIETICEIKNNKRREKEDAPQHTRIKKWLQKIRSSFGPGIDDRENWSAAFINQGVRSYAQAGPLGSTSVAGELRVEDIIIRGIKWSKLLDPNKKGQWWFGDVSPAAEDVDKVAGKIDKEVHEAQKMLQLASKLRMNTDTRKAIFCVIMSSEDYLDAFEKLLGLNLQGKHDREIMRVLVECCLQEKVFNKYYTALASKLCSHDKNHKFTLQVKIKLPDFGFSPFGLMSGYCLWDQFKELESMPLLRSMHLAKFVAEMITGFTLSLAVLKVVDLIDGSQLTAKRIIHFRMLLEAIFEHPDSVVWNVFTRAAITPELEELRNGLEFFIREYVVTSNKAAGKKFKLAKKALNNAEVKGQPYLFLINGKGLDSELSEEIKHGDYKLRLQVQSKEVCRKERLRGRLRIRCSRNNKWKQNSSNMNGECDEERGNAVKEDKSN